ncbi:MAG: protein kinase, partial [bacterium]
RDQWERRISQGVEQLRQWCLGIQAGHLSGVIHGRIKPEHLLIADTTCKVTGFTLSHPFGNLLFNEHDWDGAPPTLYRSYLYAAPEMFDPEGSVDVRSDIYSIGCVFFENLAPECHPPFDGTLSEVRAMHQNAPVPRISGIPENLWRCVSRCLQKDPGDRYQSFEELIHDLGGRERAVTRALLPKTTNEFPSRSKMSDDLWTRVERLMRERKYFQARQILEPSVKNTQDPRTAREVLKRLNRYCDQANSICNKIEESKRDCSVTLFDLAKWAEQAIEICPDHPLCQLHLSEIFRRAFRAELMINKRDEYKREGQHGIARTFSQRAKELLGKPVVRVKDVERLSMLIDSIRDFLDSCTDFESHPGGTVPLLFDESPEKRFG